MISIFLPIRKGSRRIINKNLKKLPYFKNGLTELKIKQLEKFKKREELEKRFLEEYSRKAREVEQLEKENEQKKKRKREEEIRFENAKKRKKKKKYVPSPNEN